MDLITALQSIDNFAPILDPTIEALDLAEHDPDEDIIPCDPLDTDGSSDILGGEYSMSIIMVLA